MTWDIVSQRTKDMAVHAVLLPGSTRGEVLYFGGYRVDDTHRYDVEAQTVFDISAALSPDYNTFCSGHAFLADGRVLVGAGQLHLFDENNNEIPPPPTENPGDIEHAIHGGMTDESRSGRQPRFGRSLVSHARDTFQWRCPRRRRPS
jgi:hypothetical protein